MTSTLHTQASQRGSKRVLRTTTSDEELSVTLSVSGAKAEDFEQKLAESMEQVITALLEGREVTVMSDAAEMTTTMAAKKLGISRPTLMRLISTGEIPAHKVGSHYRLLNADISEYRKQQLRERTRRQLEAFNAMRELEERENIVLNP